jgi:CHAT domain-containing protein
MFKKYLFVSAFIFFASSFFSQGIGSMLKDKMEEKKDKVKEKAREKLEKQQKEYDESNFNYSICFLDNSGLFEADEKGSAFNGFMLNGAKLAAGESKTNEDRAYTQLKHGEFLLAGNKYYLAEQHLRLAKLIYEEDGVTSNPNYIQTLSDLGLLYQSWGRYVKAKPYSELALKLREGSENKTMLTVSVNNNAVLKKENGFYTEAEAEFKRALELSKKQNDVLSEVLVLNNLAMTYLDMNKLKEAEANMLAGISKASTILKENASNYIKLQINLANIYRFEKKYNNSEDLYLIAIKQKEKKLGSHPDLAHLKKGLAQLYMEMGKTSDVEALLKSAYSIDKRKLGEKNPATLAIQQELANFYRYNNNLPEALSLGVEVVTLKKSIYGENHPNYIQALEDLALTHWQNNNLAEAKNNYKIVIDNTLQYINSFFNSLNDNEKTLYWEKTNTRLQRFYAFANQNFNAQPELLSMFYNTVINTKGFLLNNSAKIRNVIVSGSDEALKAAYMQWLETKEHLNQAYQLSNEELLADKINLDSLQKRSDELERELSQKSALFREGTDEKPVTFDLIQKKLKANESAVEIIELNDYKNGFTGNVSYIALVLTPNGIKQVLIGDSKTIHNAIEVFREKTIAQKPENEAYGPTWKAIDEQLTGAGKLYVSCDGAYHQLSINALKDVTGKYLADKYSIQFVGNTKDIIALKQKESAATKPLNAFLIGNPLYGKNETVPQLPGTEAEVKNITKLLSTYKVKTTALYGPNATEAKVKSLSSPGILHIATHGYFLADLSQMETTKVLGIDIAAAKENPLLRSGLLLANCDNVFDENFHPSPSSENGVLTAYEAMSLNLDKTDLVVLSACETGLGSVKQGEGVYGLQRAFLIAGANSIVMSLWSVSDDATMQLMTFFYTNYAKTGNKAQSFSDAIKQLKVKYKQPFFWGAFVMLSK